MKHIINTKHIITLFLFSLSLCVTAQDPRFTQVLSNPLHLNPAMMGLNPDIKFMLHYRNQWGAISNGYSTYSFTSLLPIFKKEDGTNKIDLGLNVMNDVAGAYNNLNVSFAAGYNVKISQASFVNFSAMGGYCQRLLDANSLTFDQQYVLGAYNANNPNNETVLNKKVSFADINIGAMWYTAPISVNLGEERKIMTYLGGSVYHLNTPPNESFSGGTISLPRRFSVQAGMKITGEKFDFSPNVYTNTQAANTILAAGLLVDYKIDATNKLSAGAWYRSQDAIAFCAGYSWKNFRLMYSYDITSTSPISNSSGALQTHEITLSANFNKAEKKGVKIVPSFL